MYYDTNPLIRESPKIRILNKNKTITRIIIIKIIKKNFVYKEGVILWVLFSALNTTTCRELYYTKREPGSPYYIHNSFQRCFGPYILIKGFM